MGTLMAKKGITDHDKWVIREALATALIALEQRPPNILIWRISIRPSVLNQKSVAF